MPRFSFVGRNPLSDFVTVDDLLVDPDPLDLPVRKRDKKTGDLVDATLRVWPRRPTDIERDLIMQSANGARRRLRAELNDEKSEKRQLLLIEPLEDSNDEALRTLWVNGHLMDRALQLQLNSLEEREVVPEPEGDIVGAKQRDQYDESVRAAEGDRVKHLMEAIEASQKELAREAKSIPHDQLMLAAMPAHIETLAGREWTEAYTNQLIARCTFSDKDYRKAAFKTVSQVEALRVQQPNAYRLLNDAHRGLVLEMEPSLGFSHAPASS